ncbi:MAG: SIMPL domain-containing protein [Proteobacteria bacterium]|nr:DUF541 domain-containing protein [Desulfobulbaceae bacterium]MBU4152075.1 SIMPL domain-containing protein [Pseudomonadota bacterium]MDP2105173.1 SIMPL domain-containing protein [Desulfobulbaceae bacterium]
MRKISLAIIAILLLPPFSTAWSHDPAMQSPSDGTIIQAEGNAQTQVQNDFLSIDLVFEKDNANLSQLNEIMQHEAATALGKATKNSVVTVKTSGFSIYPVYERERIIRHHGTYQLSLETKKFDAGLALASDMQPFQVRNLSFSVSPELRRATEKKLLEQAIADLRDTLNIAAGTLGAKDITMINLTIGNREYSPIQPRLMRDPIAMKAASPPPIAAEAGESQVVITVTGSAVAK